MTDSPHDFIIGSLAARRTLAQQAALVRAAARTDEVWALFPKADSAIYRMRRRVVPMAFPPCTDAAPDARPRLPRRIDDDSPRDLISGDAHAQKGEWLMVNLVRAVAAGRDVYVFDPKQGAPSA